MLGGLVTNEQLVARYAATRSAATLDQIVRSNQKLLHHVLKRFAASDEPYEDLVQVANLGLIKAAQRFDPERGVKFSTYAVPVIEGEVTASPARLAAAAPAALGQEGLRADRRGDQRAHARLGRQPQLGEIAEELNISEAGILEVLGLYARIDLHGLDELDPGRGRPRQRPRGRSAVAASRVFALPIEDRIALYDALDKLSTFERKLIYLLFFREFTQHEVAAALGLTQKKVSRESIKALGRLKSIMTRKII